MKKSECEVDEGHQGDHNAIRTREPKGDKDHQDDYAPIRVRERKGDEDHQDDYARIYIRERKGDEDHQDNMKSDRDLAPAEPDEGVALPSSRNLPPLEPKHKAVILYLMFFADEAYDSCTNSTESSALVMCPHSPASEVLEEVYDLHVHPNSIRDYYWQVRLSAEKVGLKWDQDTVADIISSQVKDTETFDEVIFVLVNQRNNKELSPYLRWFIGKVYHATDKSTTDSNTQKELRDRLEKTFKSKARDPSRYQDPDIKPSLSIKTAADTLNYRFCDALKKHLDDLAWTPGSED